ncbi:flagellar hook-basal body complex protein FliE [Yersinia enterocolitica]
MDKVGAITTPNMQLPMIAEMQQMAAIASNRVEFGTTLPQPAGSSLFAQGNGTNSPSFSRVLRGAIDSVNNLQHVASDKQTAMDMGVSDDLSGTMLLCLFYRQLLRLIAIGLQSKWWQINHHL